MLSLDIAAALVGVEPSAPDDREAIAVAALPVLKPEPPINQLWIRSIVRGVTPGGWIASKDARRLLANPAIKAWIKSETVWRREDAITKQVELLEWIERQQLKHWELRPIRR